LKILVLTFCYEPDLTAGSFKNSALVKSLSKMGGEKISIDVLTTMPNKFKSYEVETKSYEEKGNVKIWRIDVPPHQTGFTDRMWTYKSYYFGVWDIIKKNKTKYDIVYASTSRLFTGYLGAKISKKMDSKFYLDVRDIFVDTIKDVISNPIIRNAALPVFKFVETYTLKSVDHLNIVSGGFEEYFKKYSPKSMSIITNGIDDEFLNYSFEKKESNSNGKKIITYAGNMGEGQGLDKIIPQIASKTQDKYIFRLIGGGGTKDRLVEQVEAMGLSNVEFIDPVNREKLLEYYRETDFLFLHLNDYPAFEKVLPSKIFEYAATGKPIIAGVPGYSKQFLQDYVDNVILFDQCDTDQLFEKLNKYEYRTSNRNEFVNKFKRKTVADRMSKAILGM